MLIYDIETFNGCFTFVGQFEGNDEYVEFMIHESRNDLEEFIEFLEIYGPKMVGYNNIGFDAHVVEHIYRGKIKTAEEIYDFAQEIISIKEQFDLPYKEIAWYPKLEPMVFSFPQLDLMKMNNYGIYGKPTSLKWLEFTTRQKSIKDLPFPFDHYVDTEKKAEELLHYNRKDVDMTMAFYLECLPALEMRRELFKEYEDMSFFNKPNPSIGEGIILKEYCKLTGKSEREVKKTYTKRKEIVVKDLIFPFIEFKQPIFKQVKKDFEELVLKADDDGVIKIKGVYDKTIEYQDMKVVFGLGGLHGCVPPGIYKTTDTHVLMDFDVGGMYPNMAIANELYPEHLGKDFTTVFKSIGEMRKLYPKGTELNKAYKESNNSVFGKSNSKHNGFLKDPQYTISTTVNGQLLLSMLTEKLDPYGKFIFNNTDGSMILLDRKHLDTYYKVCKEWEDISGIYLEHDEIEAIWLKDVNNYITRTTAGKVKRKGMFAIYEDYKGSYHMNASALIIPEAINAYFLEGKDPSDTIKEWDNIHDFLYGIKGGRNFEYLYIHLLGDGENNISLPKANKVESLNERAIRYYMSTAGGILLKNWTGGKKQGSKDVVGKGQSPKLLMSTSDKAGKIFRTKKIDGEKILESRYPDLDHHHYIDETWRWINLIENKK